MPFTDRTQAALALCKRLEHFRGTNPLVLGIPRGAVPMAKIIAEHLNGDLDLVLVHKIGSPENPEYAIGAVSESGIIYGKKPVGKLAQSEIEKLIQRRKVYSPLRTQIDPKNRTVIIVDDGIATGSTMLAAVLTLRNQGPKKLIIATPVVAKDTLKLFTNRVDEIVALETPEELFSISQFYDDFPQVTDDEVLSALLENQNAA